MGIAGLLPALKSITERVHLDSFKGQCIAVDAYSWLHKGVYTCAIDLLPLLAKSDNITAAASTSTSTKHIDYCIQRLKQLLYHGIKPIIVFDGAPLPSKDDKEQERRLNRERARQRAQECLQCGQVAQAASWMARCIDVTPDMAHQFIVHLRRLGISYVVAPYEADAQLAWLALNNKVTAVIAEDSDLLVYGISQVLFKVDRQGMGELIQLSRIKECTSLDLTRFSFSMLRQMCILGGCDYVPALNGIGLRTAHRYLLKYRSMMRVIQVWRSEGGRNVPTDYENQVKRAEFTFRHQYVFDTDRLVTCPLTPIDDSGGLSLEKDFIGTMWDPVMAIAICKEALICPITKIPFVTSFEIPQNDDSLLLENEAKENFNMKGNDDADGALQRRQEILPAIPRYFAMSSSSTSTFPSRSSVLIKAGMQKRKMIKVNQLPERQSTIKDYFLPKKAM